jgi:uncharacterized membrane protein YfcA
MGGRYSTTNRRHIDFDQYRPSPAPQVSGVDRKNADEADFLRFLASVAPAAGTAIGGVAGGLIGGAGGAVAVPGVGAVPGWMVGAPVGASIGGAAGTALGGVAGYAAGEKTGGFDDQLAAYEDDEADKANRKSALLDALLRMR